MESCVAKDWWTTQCLMGQGGYLTQTAYTHKAVFDLHPETDVLRSNFRRLDEWMRFDPPDRKPVRLSLVFLLGFLFSLAVVVGLTWLFAAYETANWFPWLHEPRLSQDKFFEVIRNAVTMGAALGVGITLFFSYRRQRTTEGTSALPRRLNVQQPKLRRLPRKPLNSATGNMLLNSTEGRMPSYRNSGPGTPSLPNN